MNTFRVYNHETLLVTF